VFYRPEPGGAMYVCCVVAREGGVGATTFSTPSPAAVAPGSLRAAAAAGPCRAAYGPRLGSAATAACGPHGGLRPWRSLRVVTPVASAASCLFSFSEAASENSRHFAALALAHSGWVPCLTAPAPRGLDGPFSE
jgi:hypothetical protein